MIIRYEFHNRRIFTKKINKIPAWLPCPGASNHFTKDLWAHNLNIKKNNFCFKIDLTDPSRLQLFTCHDSSAGKLWPDWIAILHVWSICIFTGFGLWAHKPFVKWVHRSNFLDAYVSYNKIVLRPNIFCMSFNILHLKTISVIYMSNIDCDL